MTPLCDGERMLERSKKCLTEHYNYLRVEREIPVRGEGMGRVTKTINLVTCRLCGNRAVLRTDWRTEVLS